MPLFLSEVARRISLVNKSICPSIYLMLLFAVAVLCNCCRCFRRGDGGRYSMRFSGGTTKAGHPASTPVGKSERPPFRVGVGGRGQVNFSDWYLVIEKI